MLQANKSIELSYYFCSANTIFHKAYLLVRRKEKWDSNNFFEEMPFSFETDES